MKSIRTEIKWAVIFIVMTLLWMWLEKLTGLHSSRIHMHIYLTNLFAIPAIIVYALALRDKKKTDYNGQMSYKQGFISGLILTLIITLFAPLTQWVISTIITPEYFPNVIEHSLETGYYETREEAEAFFNLKNYMLQNAIGSFIMGVVTAAVVALFVRSKPKGQ